MTNSKHCELFMQVLSISQSISVNVRSFPIIQLHPLFLKQIRILLAPIIIEGEEQRNNSGILLRLSISIPRADIREVLSDACVPLLVFQRDTVSSSKTIEIKW